MSHKIFDTKFFAVSKIKVTSNFQQTYIHWNVYAQRSKILMYKFHYDYIKNKFGNKSRLLFTYYDRSMYEIKLYLITFL